VSATDKEGLSLICLAMGGLVYIEGVDGWIYEDAQGNRGSWFNPYTSIADCADMEAALKINVAWFSDLVQARQRTPHHLIDEKSYADFPTEQAARMAASCAVGEQIGLRIREGQGDGR